MDIFGYALLTQTGGKFSKDGTLYYSGIDGLRIQLTVGKIGVRICERMWGMPTYRRVYMYVYLERMW